MPGLPIRIAIDVGVVVADMERSLAFYCDLLGLAAIAEIPTTLIGRGRMVQLQHGQSLIKLVEMERAPAQQSPAGIAAALGYRYITLLVPEIAAIMATMEKAAIAVPITRLDNGTQIAMVADPDGNIVEFVQAAQNVAED